MPYAIVQGRGTKPADPAMSEDARNAHAVAAARADCEAKLAARLEELAQAGDADPATAEVVVGDPGWEYATAVVQGHIAY